MEPSATPAAPCLKTGSVAARGTVFLAFWFVLLGPPARATTVSATVLQFLPDLLVGLSGAAVATWISLVLLPPQPIRPSGSGLVRLAWHFLSSSLRAGVDVARRALDPRMPLNTGFVEYPVRLPAGPLRHAFTAMTSLLPGTLPVRTKPDGTVVYHCLDVGQPVVRQLGIDESVLCRALRPEGAAPVAPVADPARNE